jgi:hypothetical protein
MSLNLLTTLTVIECGECGVAFAMADSFIAQRRKDHQIWYCPNGHQRYYSGENEAERLKRELEDERSRTRFYRERQEVEARSRVAAEHQARAYKGVATRVKRRIAVGVCPCCNRTFQDLQRHMSGQHPDFRQGLGLMPAFPEKEPPK